MAEWLKAHAWKACLGETLTWVRIPLSPPVPLLQTLSRLRFHVRFQPTRFHHFHHTPLDNHLSQAQNHTSVANKKRISQFAMISALSLRAQIQTRFPSPFATYSPPALPPIFTALPHTA